MSKATIAIGPFGGVGAMVLSALVAGAGHGRVVAELKRRRIYGGRGLSNQWIRRRHARNARGMPAGTLSRCKVFQHSVPGNLACGACAGRNRR